MRLRSLLHPKKLYRHLTGAGTLHQSVVDYVAGIRGSRPSARELKRILATMKVHPDIVAGAGHILRTGAKLGRITNHDFILKKGNASERLAFYAISALANWPSFVEREQLKNRLAGGEHSYSAVRIDPDAGALALPPVNSPLLKAALAEAEACFATNTSSSVNPGKETIRSAPLVRHLWDSDIYRFGSDPAILRIVSEYLGLVPVLLRINLLLSENDRLQAGSSQFPHLDPEDFRQMKIFLHVNDVDLDTGPFQVLRADASDRVQNRFLYRLGRLTDDQLFEVATTDDLIVCLGPSGTASFADTSRGFHFGSRPSPKQRKLVMLQYVTPFAATWPIAAKEISAKYTTLARERVAQGGSLSSDEECLLALRR